MVATMSEELDILKKWQNAFAEDLRLIRKLREAAEKNHYHKKK